jgi:hypothetical protein
MMNEQDKRNIDIVRRFYQQEKELAAPDIVWHVPGHNPVSGPYSGYDEYFNRMLARMAPLTQWDIELRDVMVNGEYVMTTYRLQGERKDKRINLEGGHLFRLNAEGQIAEGWGFTNNQDALDDFFSA